MNIEYLTTMVNDISHYFVTEADHAAAISSIAQHLNKLWEPRMRQQILQHLDAGAAGLEPLAHEAVQKLAEMESPRTLTG